MKTNFNEFNESKEYKGTSKEERAKILKIYINILKNTTMKKEQINNENKI